MANSDSSLRPLDRASPSLTERTIEAVREGIRNEALVPGELYSVYRLAEDLGVSRSPVRDALLRLTETGIVRFERNRGFRVIVPGPKEIAEMIAVRLALEVPAARRAAATAGEEHRKALREEADSMQLAAADSDERLFMFHDQRLHTLILELAGNTYARRIIEKLRDAIRLVGASTVEQSRTLQDIHNEHLPIIEAIIRGDPASAARAMDSHLQETGRLLLSEAVRRDGGEIDEAKLWLETLGDGGANH